MIGNSCGGARSASLSAAQALGRRFACAFALWLLAAAAAPPHAHAGHPTVSGHVTDHLTGAPMAGLALTIYYNTTPFTILVIGTPVTDANGAYTWDGSCPVSLPRYCYVEAYADGYLYTNRSFQQSSDDVTVDLAPIRAATVSGNFTIDGAVADHAIGAAIQYFHEDSGQWAPPAPITYDEADAHYSIGRLPFDHDYRVCAGGPNVDVVRQCWNGHEQTTLSADPVSDVLLLDEGEQRDDIDFDFHSGGAIEGTVHDAYIGAPLAGRPIGIRIYDASGNWVDGAGRMTDANGAYRVAGFPDGDYYVAIDAADNVFADGTQVFPGIVCPDQECADPTLGQRLTIANGSTVASVDFTLHPDVVIEGRVTDAATGDGVAQAHVFAGTSNNPDAIADADGNYRFYIGHNYVRVHVYTRDNAPLIDQVYPGIPCISGTCLEQGQYLGTATGTVHEHIDFALALGASIAGRVTDASTGLPLTGIVTLLDANFNEVWWNWTDFDGYYASGAWLPGTYYARVGSSSCVFYENVPCPPSGIDPGSVMPTPIVLSLGEVRRDIDFPLDLETIFRGGFDP
jgi:hypothetical protein